MRCACCGRGTSAWSRPCRRWTPTRTTRSCSSTSPSTAWSSSRRACCRARAGACAQQGPQRLAQALCITKQPRPQALCIIGGANGAAPAELRAFTNRDDLDFAAVAELAPAQRWELQENGAGELEYPTQCALLSPRSPVLVQLRPARDGRARPQGDQVQRRAQPGPAHPGQLWREPHADTLYRAQGRVCRGALRCGPAAARPRWFKETSAQRAGRAGEKRWWRCTRRGRCRTRPSSLPPAWRRMWPEQGRAAGRCNALQCYKQRRLGRNRTRTHQLLAPSRSGVTLQLHLSPTLCGMRLAGAGYYRHAAARRDARCMAGR